MPTATPDPTAPPAQTATPGVKPTPSPTPLVTSKPLETARPTPSAAPVPTSDVTVVPVETPAGTDVAPATLEPSASPEATATSGPSESPANGPTAAPGGLVWSTPTGPPAYLGQPLVFDVPSAGTGTVDLAGAELAAAVLGSLGIFRWAVPGLALSVPGLLVILAIAVQAAGGLAWLPLVRRKIGSSGTRSSGATGAPDARVPGRPAQTSGRILRP